MLLSKNESWHANIGADDLAGNGLTVPNITHAGSSRYYMAFALGGWFRVKHLLTAAMYVRRGETDQRGTRRVYEGFN